MVVGLILLTVAVWASYVPRAGIFSDTWRGLYLDREAGRGLWQGVSECFTSLSTRPTSCVQARLELALFGDRALGLSVIALAITLASAISLYWILRLAGVSLTIASLTGALWVLMPTAASVRLWPINGAALAVLLLLLGVLLGCVAFRNPGWTRRRAAAVRSGGALLVLASLTSYEAVTPLCFMTGIPYAAAAGPARRTAVWRRAGVDAALAITWTVYRVAVNPRLVDAGTAAVAPRTGSEYVARARTLVDAGFDVLRQASAPWLPRDVAVAGVLVLVGLGGLLAYRSPRVGPSARGALAMTGSGAIAIVLGVIGLLPAIDWYTPKIVGTDNRVNVASQIGYAVFLGGLVWLASCVALWVAAAPARAGGETEPSKRGWLLVAAPLIVVAPIGLAFYHEAVRQQADWASAWAEEQRALKAMEVTLGHTTRRTAFLFDIGTVTPNWVPVFGEWEATNAWRYRTGDPSWTVRPWMDWRCIERGVRPNDPRAFAANGTTPYRDVILVDVSTARAVLPTDLATCKRVTTTWKPARLFL